MKKVIGYIAIIFLIIIDQILKFIITSNYNEGEGVSIIKDVLEIEYVKNTGAAWGMMSNATWFFAIFAIIISALLIYLYYKIPNEKIYVYLKITIVLLISGAIGNLIDRVTRGFVVDYIYFKIIDFPVFNLADIFITVAGIALVILIMFYYKDEDFEFLKITNKRKIKDN